MPFRDIVGHARLLTLLSRAIARETLPPALLFAGPEGIGKRRTALAVAEALNCAKTVKKPDATYEVDACGTCAACRRIARGVHPDVIVLEPGDSGTIKIDQVRDVIDRAGYRPFEGRRRAVVIDQADALVPEAQNALLKTLEEPPSATVFVLVSSTPDALLLTVQSRCSRIRFAPLLADEVARVLMRDQEYDEKMARAAAADADGSVQRALDASSVDVAEARDVAKSLLALAARVSDPARRIEAAKDLVPARSPAAVERAYLSACLRSLASLLRDVSLLACRADPRVLTNVDLQGDLERLTGAFDGRRSERAFAAVGRALQAIDRNVSPKVVTDWLVLQL